MQEQFAVLHSLFTNGHEMVMNEGFHTQAMVMNENDTSVFPTTPTSKFPTFTVHTGDLYHVLR